MIKEIKNLILEYYPAFLALIAIFMLIGSLMLDRNQNLKKWNDKEISYEEYSCVVKLVEYQPDFGPIVKEKMSDGKISNSEFSELDCEPNTLEIRSKLEKSISD